MLRFVRNHSDDFCTYAGTPPARLCDEEDYGLNALERLYPAADDSWLCLTECSPREFTALTATVGASQLATAPRFANPEARRENDAALIELLTAIFATAPALGSSLELCRTSHTSLDCRGSAR